MLLGCGRGFDSRRLHHFLECIVCVEDGSCWLLVVYTSTFTKAAKTISHTNNTSQKENTKRPTPSYQLVFSFFYTIKTSSSQTFASVHKYIHKSRQNHLPHKQYIPKREYKKTNSIISVGLFFFLHDQNILFSGSVAFANNPRFTHDA